MKKQLLSILSLCLCALMLFTSCTTAGDGIEPGGTEPNGTTPEQTTPNEDPTTDPGSESESESESEPEPEPDPEQGPFVVTENYLPETVYNTLKGHLESQTAEFSCYSTANAPYVIRDIYTISNCRVKKITIPVYKTLNADANGDFCLTIYKCPTDFEDMKESAQTYYQIKVNAQEYNLKENKTILRFITVDLSEYNIVLDDDETLAFFNPSDTLLPAYVKVASGNPASTYIVNNWGVTGFFGNVFTSGMNTYLHSLVFDFEFERTYENRAAYDAIAAAEEEYQQMLAAVKALYQGKKLSILGDSISTYQNVSNNTFYHPSIGENAVYYPTSNANMMSYKQTYWGRLMQDLELTLCVNNAWSGSRVYGGGSTAGSTRVDNMLLRSSNLARADGTSPDLILVYMGINDLHNGSPEGNLYQLLTNKEAGKTDREVVAAWFEAIAAQAATTPTVTPGTTYAGWEEAYALAINNMIKTYGDDTEIYCFTLIANHHGKFTDDKLNRYNTCIRAIAEYFEVGLIDQQTGIITAENCHNYGGDDTSLHPNIKGHEAMERLIVETLYRAHVTENE